MLRTAFLLCCYKHTLLAVSPIQYTEGSHRAVEITLGGFLLPVKQEGGLVYGIQNYAKATGKIKTLVHKTCCNCYKGNCLLLDDLEMFG